MIRDAIETAIRAALKEKGVEVTDVPLSVPEEPTHGDYATSAALANSKKAGMPPRELAEHIQQVVSAVNGVAKVEIAGPGYVNVTLSSEVFATVEREILGTGAAWGSNISHKGKKVLIEKSAPNLFKPFHVGHFLNISVGESLSRLYRFSGAEVTDVSYPSDISLGVAKALWALMKGGQTKNLTVDDLGKAYVEGTRAYDEDETAKAAIDTINKKINAGEEGAEWDLYQQGRAINLAYFEATTKRLGSYFADTFFESVAGKVGKEIVSAHIPDVFTSSNGAIIFEGEKYGLHTRVFLTSSGLPVYEAKDIGLLKLKFEKYHPDISIVITDVEQKHYFEVIKKAASLIEPTWAAHSFYWQHGRLRFEGGKVSSRYGNVPLAEDLLEQVSQKVRDQVMQSVRVAEEGKAQLVEHIALGALKYAFLKPSTGHNIVFDFERSISLTGDSGPYLQYTYARAQSVVSAVREAGVEPKVEAPHTELERLVARLLMQFPSVVQRAQQEYAPHHVAQYAGELASLYNSWYAKERVVGTPDAARRAALTEAVAITLNNALWLLGIEAPERM